jgi:DNA-directed RNA polymerase subunit alpha
VGVVTAANIVADPAIEVISKDTVLATLTADVNFEMEMVVENGRGYVPVSDRITDADRFEQEIGRINLDAVYSPVTRVRYLTENTRVGQRTNYDKLILEIWTNGTITPEMALVEAAKILRKHINPFVQYFEIGEETVAGEVSQEEPEPQVDQELEAKLNTPIQELELSVRASNCLESVKVETVRQLVQMTDADLLKIRSFGKTSLREIKRKLADIGLSLGMKDVGKPPEG